MIDDAPDVAEVVAFGARMTWPDCEVSLAGDGREALRRFEAEQPDLVVLDVSMPPPGRRSGPKGRSHRASRQGTSAWTS